MKASRFITTKELRKKYLKFFKNKNHKVFPSDTLVPDDTSLLFTSAGMNQFKPYFLGEKKDVSRAVSCQKCLRTGDLERVGETAYHHTFFEMLGNFSFGDYFKKEAIELAWEFITKELNMDEKDLWVSVYKDDDEAYNIWKENIAIPEERIVKLGEDSNFWPANAPSLGPDGPCGPCSEIFFDRGENVGCKKKECNPDCSCGRFVEVWNLVFTQFNRVGVNKLEPLPQKNIDTGMGLERMAAVLQKVESNFEIDILAPVVREVRGLVEKTSRPDTVNSVNAIVDHARAATFAIADGVYPSNEGRGYVIRRIIRRALLKARYLGYKKPFLFKLPKRFAELMGDAYPEIKQKKDSISKIIASEEEKYFSTIKEGQALANLIMDELDKVAKKEFPPEDVFRLYDTHGVPLEIIKQFAQTRGFNVDEEKFEELLKKQQERSRKKSMFEESIFTESSFNLKEKSEFMPSSAVRDVSLAPLVLRYDFPEEWKIALVIPEKSRKIFDIHEKNLFLKYCPIDRREVERVSHIILMNLLPALCEKDLDMFGKAIQMIQNVGFKKIEIKEQNNIVKKVLNILNEDYFAGMSSFGPTIYVITDTNEKEIKKIGKEFGCNVFITECANKGYEMVE